MVLYDQALNLQSRWKTALNIKNRKQREHLILSWSTLTRGIPSKAVIRNWFQRLNPKEKKRRREVKGGWITEVTNSFTTELKAVEKRKQEKLTKAVQVSKFLTWFIFYICSWLDIVCPHIRLHCIYLFPDGNWVGSGSHSPADTWPRDMWDYMMNPNHCLHPPQPPPCKLQGGGWGGWRMYNLQDWQTVKQFLSSDSHILIACPTETFVLLLFAV